MTHFISLPDTYRMSLVGHKVYFRRDDAAQVITIVKVQPLEQVLTDNLFNKNAHMGDKLKLARFALRIFAISVYRPYEPTKKGRSQSSVPFDSMTATK